MFEKHDAAASSSAVCGCSNEQTVGTTVDHARALRLAPADPDRGGTPRACVVLLCGFLVPGFLEIKKTPCGFGLSHGTRVVSRWAKPGIRVVSPLSHPCLTPVSPLSHPFLTPVGGVVSGAAPPSARALTRLGMTDLYRAKFPDAPHYTWSGTNGKGQSRSRIDSFWVNDAAIAMAGGLASMLTAMGSHPGKLGTDHTPIFARFAARMDEASTSDEPSRDKPRRHAPPSAPRVYSTQPKGPTQCKLSPRQTKRYSHTLDHLHDDPRFASVLSERATYQTARRLHRANAHAADMLGITGVVTHDLIAARLHEVTVHDCPEVVEALRHLSRSTGTTTPDFYVVELTARAWRPRA